MASTFPEATVKDSIECLLSRRVLGVRARRTVEENKGVFFADLVVAVSYFSNFRSVVMDSDRSRSTQLCAAISSGVF